MKLRRPGGLWLHRDFRNLWAAETISVFGSQVDDLAIGFVAILVLDASAFEVAVLGTLNFAPFILLTLPAGVWVDRLRRRPILISADFGRAGLLATVPVAYALDALTLTQLYVVVFLVGACQVFFDVAYQSYLPSLVDRNQLVEGNSKLEISRSSAQVTGPGLGGALVEVVTAPYAVLVDALSFVASGAFLLRIRKREVVPRVVTTDGRKPSMRSELKEGLRFVGGNPNLRAQAGCTATSNLFSSLAFSIFLVFAVRELRLSAAVIGLVFSVGAAGSLLAAFTARRISDRFGIGPTSIVMAAVFGPSFLLVALAPAGNEADPLPDRGTAPLRVHRRRLQHRSGELPAGDLPAALAGADELSDAVHRLGDDPDRDDRGRRPCNVDRPARDDRRRRRRRRPGVPVAPALAATAPARPPGADRRAMPIEAEAAGGSPRAADRRGAPDTRKRYRSVGA